MSEKNLFKNKLNEDTNSIKYIIIPTINTKLPIIFKEKVTIKKESKNIIVLIKKPENIDQIPRKYIIYSEIFEL
jgi:hypothetical protein